MFSLLVLNIVSILCSIAHADEATSRVMEFVPASEENAMAFASLESGRVLRLPLARTSEEQIAMLAAAAGAGNSLKIRYNDLGDEDEILDVQREAPSSYSGSYSESSTEGHAPPAHASELTTMWPHNLGPLVHMPTILFSFLASKNLPRNSQCYERAYVWAYHMWEKFGLMSGKVFVFFSPNFIRQHRYRWWFHVAPATSESETTTVLDASYTTGPRSVQAWLDDITPVHVNCQVISSFKGKDSLPGSHECYLRFTNMYVFGADHLRALDRNGQKPAGWMNWALSQSKRHMGASTSSEAAL